MVILSNVKRKISKEKSLVPLVGEGAGVFAVDEGGRLHGLGHLVDRPHVPLPELVDPLLQELLLLGLPEGGLVDVLVELSERDVLSDDLHGELDQAALYDVLYPSFGVYLEDLA